MSIIESIALSFNLLFCLPSLASLTKFDEWWIRGFDFPRVQISALIIINLILALVVYSFNETWHYIIFVLLAASLLYQFWLIFPYTVLAKKQVKSYAGKQNCVISILVSNVLMTNRDYDSLIELIKDKDPTVFLILESDKEWENALNNFDKAYPYAVKIPLDNLYGMHLYSKFELQDMEIKHLVEDDIPSIHGYIKLDNGVRTKIHCLHPRPPSPTESSTSTNRDAELLLMGKVFEHNTEPALVFGDFNDVAWSRTTKMFQRLSGLMDPRRGRGFFNTFSADYKLLRWPLDHVFHTNDFTLIDISRERNIGSDHFPMYIKLNYSPEKKAEQKALKIDDEEKEWAEEKIEKGVSS